MAALAPPKPKPVDAKLAATGKWAYFIDGDVTCAKWIEPDFKQVKAAIEYGAMSPNEVRAKEGCVIFGKGKT